MLKLKARAGESTGRVKNFLGAVKEEGRLKGLAELPEPSYLVIEEGDSGYYLFYFRDGADKCFADDWFETVEQAKAQVLAGYGVQEPDWSDESSA